MTTEWKLVPVEPTPEMLEATWQDDAVTEADGYNAIRAAVYRAMLAAAPTPQAREPVGILWQHGRTGRTRVQEPGQEFCDNRGWHRVGPLYLHPAPTPPEQADARDTSAAFDTWWDAGNLMKVNPYNEGTPAFWAWEGWWAAKGEPK